MSLPLRWHDEDLLLLPERAVWWPAQRMLVVADLHLGKAATFRALGSPVPDDPTVVTLNRLSTLIAAHDPATLMILGDLFHDREGTYGATGDMFETWLEFHHSRDVRLAVGNHDRRAKLDHLKMVMQPSFEVGPFTFQHYPHEIDRPSMAGHLHPGMKIRGKGLWREKLPCFWVNALSLVLPAFGEFTGLAMMASGGARMFAIAGSEVIEIPG